MTGRLRRLRLGCLALAVAACASGVRERVEGGYAVAFGFEERGQYEYALSVARATLAEAETEPGHAQPHVAALLEVVAESELALGRPDEALRAAERSHRLMVRAKGSDHPFAARSLLLIASIHRTTGHYAEAEDHAQRALAILEDARRADPLATAAASYQLAAISFDLGDYERAEARLARAHARLVREPRLADWRLGATLAGFGRLYARLGKTDEAASLYDEALPILEQRLGSEHPHVAEVLTAVAELRRDTGELALAEWPSRRALEIHEATLGDHNPRLAWSLYGLAEVYRGLEEYGEAEPLYTRAAALAEGSGLAPLEWHVYSGYAQLLAETDRRNAAIYFGKRAVNLLQSTRTGILQMQRSVQGQFVEQNRAHYERLADWLIDEGRLPEAQVVLQMLKEEELFDFLQRGEVMRESQLARIGLNRAEEEAQERYREATQGLGRMAARHALLDRRRLLQPESFAPEDRRELEALDERLRTARAAVRDRIGAIVETLRSEGRGEVVGEKQLASLRPLRSTLARLGPGTALIHYLITDDRLHAILTTESTQLVRTSAIRREELHRLLHEFRNLVASPTLRDPRKSGARLYDLLIAPLRRDLDEAGASTLMVSLDGALRYVPMAALWDPERARFLVEDFALAIYLEAARQALERPAAPHWRAAGLGLTHAVPGFGPLPAAHDELEAIIHRAEADGDGILPGEIYLDGAFSADRLSDVLLRGYPVVHLASHFVFSPGTDDDSFLVLGDGSRLTLAQMQEQDIAFHDVDLLTLSACETAVTPRGSGREVEGFGALAVHHGAAGVLATLWRVDDRSTSTFMPRFYESKVRKRSTKAAALRDAQRSFIAREPAAAGSPETAAAEAGIRAPLHGYQHPYYWAAFVLLGNLL